MRLTISVLRSRKNFTRSASNKILTPGAVLPALFCISVLLVGAACRSSAGPEKATQSGERKDTGNVFKAKAPEAQIFADDAMWRPPYAVIGGTVENISGEKLDNLVVELELKRRDDSGSERRTVDVTPRNLPPGEKGKYSIKVLREEWSGSKVVGLRSSSRDSEVAFKTLPGARRPPERVPEPKPITRVVEVPRPRQKSNGEEFINTPDNPERVP
jgi:hypothetical protein